MAKRQVPTSAQSKQVYAFLTASFQRGVSVRSSSAESLLPTPTQGSRGLHLEMVQLTPKSLPRRQAVRGVAAVERWGREDMTASSRRRWFSSHKWGFIDATTEKANEDSAKLPAAMVHEAGEAQVDRVEKAMRGMALDNEDFTVRREGLEIFVDLAAGLGSYWVQYDKSLRQICFLSPRSGAYRYNLEGSTGRWIGEADRHDFEGMLTRDIIQQAYGIPNFDAK